MSILLICQPFLILRKSCYNEGSVHKLTLGGKNFDKVEKDQIIYKDGNPWSVIGVFYVPDKQFYVTTPTGIASFTPKESTIAG